MTCESCGDKPKKCDKDFTKAVIEIDNPEQITLMRKVTIPASMGDDTTVPPVVGKYKNVLLYYEANSKTYIYSSDGIPTQLVNGVTDYEAAVNLPQINGHTLLGNKTATQLGLQDKLTAGENISIDGNNVISATYGPATDTEIGLVKPGDGLSIDTDGTLSISDIEQYAHVFDTVADMKAATNLVAGDYARTLGFHTVNDSGGALYKITDTGTANEMDVIAVDDLYATLVKTSGTLNVKQIGLVGDGINDNYNHFVKIGQLVNTLKYTKVIFSPENYKLSDQVDFTISGKEIELDFNGASVDYYPSTAFADRHALIDVIFPKNSVRTVSVIKNGKFTTSGITPDWTEDYTSPTGSGMIVRSYARNATFDNLEFNDIFFGYSILSFYGCNIDVINCRGVNVGGRSATGSNDYAGDAIYFGFSGVVFDEDDKVDRDNSLPVTINVENCNFKAHEAITGSGTLLNRNHSGRCGVCLCEYSKTPQQKNITISNSYFYNYQRALHSEANENVTLKVNNTVFEECATVLLGGGTITNVEFDNCTFNKTLDLAPMSQSYDGLYTSGPDSVAKNVMFNNCIITGNIIRLTLLATNIVLFNHCYIEAELLKATTGGHIVFDNCNIKANAANVWYQVITDIFDSKVELGYKHDANSQYFWRSGDVVTSSETYKTQMMKGNDFVNCGFLRIVSDAEVLVLDNNFTYDNNFPSALGYLFNFTTSLRSFCRNIVNNTSGVNYAISGGVLADSKLLISENIFIGCGQGFYNVTGFNITMSNNKFDAGTKTIATATDLTSSYIICNNNTYKGFTATSPIANSSNSVLFDNYKIVDNTATLIP